MRAAAVLAIAALAFSQAAAAAPQVTCDSLIKLRNGSRLNIYLHSHEVAYGSGSGQQSVTGIKDGADANSYWLVKGSKEAPCPQGEYIQKGRQVRLQHVGTKKWLHSHLHRSPLSGQQEVSAYGSSQQSDAGDVWTVSWDGSASSWEIDTKVALQHVDTKRWLTASDSQYNRPIAGQHEVAAANSKGAATWWQAAEGVYLGHEEHAGPPTDEL